ncbi:TIR domain-containing protein [Hyphomicrobium sp. LHD-15]|uniref:TIR domain-containing protein n=1 Tax=Hyphomicrobium sp. LHD-15 TaxID=3072142 RepID=UPI0028101FAC|nr:TIR domain-containing protein [Hyphomicrobium sp. LHD-15]MDQ8699237.1 nucleotide-binding protein [Hyphomicrobium sp. LHD-15]
MGISERFKDKSDLIAALLRQQVIGNNREIADDVAQIGELLEFEPGQQLIEQGCVDREIYFLLAGEARVIVNGVRMHTRGSGVTVGEMSALNSTIARSATIEAEKETAAWRITHARLEEVADRRPELWKRLAVDLAGRLEQRNSYVNRANVEPRLFMICSAEALDIAKCIRIGLKQVTRQIVIWSDEQIFESGSYPLEALEKEVNQADFAIALAEPDDIIRSRDRAQATVRDNVIFELGFFMSRLGRARSLLLVPRGTDVKLPSDFKGLTPVGYSKVGPGGDMPVILGPTIDEIGNIVKKKGVRASLVEVS